MGRTSNARQRLLEAASNLLWEKSYHSVTVDEVCARASVRKGSLYHFFDSKNALAVAALQHFWDTVALPAYEEHFSRNNPPLARIACYLDWLQRLQREKLRHTGKVLGWPFFSLGCELGASEPAITRKLHDVESAEAHYFECAISDAISEDAIETCNPRTEALALRATMAGILARARALGQLDDLCALGTLPATILRLKPAGRAFEVNAPGRSPAAASMPPRPVLLGNGKPFKPRLVALIHENEAQESFPSSGRNIRQKRPLKVPAKLPAKKFKDSTRTVLH